MNGKLRNMTGIYLLKGDKILLLYRQGGKVVNNVWTASAGGHFEKDEINDARACVERELREELGLTLDDVENLQFRYICLRSTKGEIRQNYYFFAELKESVDENLSSNEGQCQWFSLDEITSLKMPFSAKYVVEHFCKLGKFTNTLYVGITTPEEVTFFNLTES